MAFSLCIMPYCIVVVNTAKFEIFSNNNNYELNDVPGSYFIEFVA